MAWIKPEYSRKKVGKAGDCLRNLKTSDLNDFFDALDVLSNWRASHAFPLNTVKAFLRGKSLEIDKTALVVQRLKRTPSIISKLIRFPSMKLSRMQDIGGCRAVVKSGWHVIRLRNSIVKSRTRHKLVNEKNYITKPKLSGYRGIHLVYQYQGTKTKDYNNLLIEIQLRTRMQHAWATAVEIMGAFLKESLKSSQGPEEWLNYFSLVSIEFAVNEGVPPENMSDKELEKNHKKVKSLSKSLNVIKRLGSFRIAANHLEQTASKSDYYLLNFRPDKNNIEVFRYKKNQLDVATDHYLELEKAISEIPGADVVLVAAESIEELKTAYPNYFADSREFIKHLIKIQADRSNV